MKIVKGRNFSGLARYITQHYCKREHGERLWMGNNPIGKKVKYAGDTSGFYFEVVGVVKDFNQKSLYNPIAPLMFFYKPANNIIAVKT